MTLKKRKIQKKIKKRKKKIKNIRKAMMMKKKKKSQKKATKHRPSQLPDRKNGQVAKKMTTKTLELIKR